MASQSFSLLGTRRTRSKLFSRSSKEPIALSQQPDALLLVQSYRLFHCCLSQNLSNWCTTPQSQNAAAENAACKGLSRPVQKAQAPLLTACHQLSVAFDFASTLLWAFALGVCLRLVVQGIFLWASPSHCPLYRLPQLLEHFGAWKLDSASHSHACHVF